MAKTITDREAYAAVEARSSRATVVKDELEGLAGIGVPAVRDEQLIAMLALSLPTARFTKEFQGKALDALKWARRSSFSHSAKHKCATRRRRRDPPPPS